MKPSPKVLFIGLDAGDIDLITRWNEEGALPNLGELGRTGGSAVITLPPRLYSGAVWPSLNTGVGPTRHGCYHYVKLEPDYGISGHRQRCDHPFFWEELGRQGRRVAIIDMPYAPLDEALNGVQIVDWTTHDPEFTEVHRGQRFASVRTHPEELAEELVRLFGRDEVGFCEQPARSLEEFREFRDRLIARIEKKVALCLHYLEQERWDLFMTVFADSHCVGHQCWHFHDPHHPRHDPAAARELGDCIKDIYVALDGAIGRLVERAGPDTTAFVFASHGMGPLYDGNVLLDHVLAALENGAPRGGLRSVSVLNRIWEDLPQGLRALLRPIRVRWKSRVREALVKSTRRSCRGFMLPTGDNCGGIRVNLAGRDPNGQVQPGEEFDAYCAALTSDLLELTDPDTGERLIEGIYRYEDLYPASQGIYNADLYNGRYLGDVPDLLVVWRQPNVTAIHSPRFGTISQIYQGSRTADHNDRGLLFAHGRGVASDGLPDEVSVLDLAPTMAALLGVELEDVEGAPNPALIGVRSVAGGIPQPT